MEREKKLAKNMIIFAIGSISSKLLQFLLLPFYTRVLTDAQYGTIDILQNIATLLIPIISMTISEAVFRYAMEEKSNKQEVLSIGLLLDCISITIMTGIAIIIYRVTKYEYIMVLVLYIATNIIRTIMSQFTRAIGRVKLYTVDNVLNVFITIICNIVLLTVLNLGVKGYLLGYSIGNIASIIILMITVKIHQYINFKQITKLTTTRMIKFSMPLIPSAIGWWITTFTDRIMITYYFGAAVNGLYALAHKIPTIITIIVEIFSKAWQMSANKEFESNDISKFYSNIFSYLFSFVFILCAFLMSFSKIIIRIIASQEFFNSWQYVPTLLLGIAFFSIADYLGTIYIASKKTKMAFVTNMVVAILNLFLNIILLKYIGAIGAAIATTICYMILWLYRVFNTRKIVEIQYNLKIVIPTIILLIINTIIITIQVKLWYCYTTIILIIMIGINLKNFIIFTKSIVTLLKDRLLRRNNNILNEEENKE